MELAHGATFENFHDMIALTGKRVFDPEKSSSSSAWARRRDAVSLEIEMAALAFFAEHGVDAVTVDEVATAAGVSRRTFYRYFRSPDDVIAAQPYRFLQHIARELRELPASVPIVEAFMAALLKGSELQEEMQIHRLLRRIMRKSPEAVSRALQKAKMQAADMLEELIADRLGSAGRDRADAGVIAAALMAIIVQVTAENRRRGRFTEPAHFAQALRVLAEVLGELKSSARSANLRSV